MGVKWEADVSMAGCQRSTTLSRKGERKGKEKEKKKYPQWKLGCQDLNRGDT